MYGHQNLPDDVGPVDIDNSFGIKHDHEWETMLGGPNGESQFVLENGVATFHYECTWREIVDSFHSERLCETFYEEGAECTATSCVNLPTRASPGLVKEFQEQFWYDGCETIEIVDIDPPEPTDPNGELVLQLDDYEIRYDRFHP